MVRITSVLAAAMLAGAVGTLGAAHKGSPPKTAYARWRFGPPADPGYFPIAVWLQSPENAPRFQKAGINLYVGLWQGPTDAQLAALKAAKMPVICEQNATGLAHRDDPTIVGWMHGDEPDNAQAVIDPKTGKENGYGPPVPPARIMADYEAIKAKDPTRPVMLNLGQGVANDEWVGRGSDAKPEDYLTYVKGSDIVSFDVYPVTGLEKPNSEDYLWYVPKGVSRLKKWTNGRKILWNCIECTRIGGGKRATPGQVKAEVWMSLIHGSTGLIYFVHQFAPTFNEHALLDDPEMLPAVTAVNRQIKELAPVLNSPTVEGGLRIYSMTASPNASVKPDDKDGLALMQRPIAGMVKRHGGATYLFTVGMRNAPATGTFQVSGVPKAKTVEVIGENRTLPIKAGKFEDRFKPYDVHLYRIKP